MKTKLFTLILSFVALTTVNAQQISVVSPSNQTTLYTDLNEAITNAAAGSTLYLSGGGFQVSTNISKKLSIIGVGHRAVNDNADGNTVISGNLTFESGSDNSVVTGVYLSGNINITSVNNMLIRYCNVDNINISGDCLNVSINQNYVRNDINGGGGAHNITNNIASIIHNIDGGIIDHNVIVHSLGKYLFIGSTYTINSQITNNIILNASYSPSGTISNNIYKVELGENSIVVTDFNEIFEGPNNGVSTTSNFKLKGSKGKNAGTDGTDIGIYGGTTGFKDSALPPGPRIAKKEVSEETDGSGNLRVKLKVVAE